MTRNTAGSLRITSTCCTTARSWPFRAEGRRPACRQEFRLSAERLTTLPYSVPPSHSRRNPADGSVTVRNGQWCPVEEPPEPGGSKRCEASGFQLEASRKVTSAIRQASHCTPIDRWSPRLSGISGGVALIPPILRKGQTQHRLLASRSSMSSARVPGSSDGWPLIARTTVLPVPGNATGSWGGHSFRQRRFRRRESPSKPA